MWNTLCPNQTQCLEEILTNASLTKSQARFHVGGLGFNMQWPTDKHIPNLEVNWWTETIQNYHSTALCIYVYIYMDIYIYIVSLIRRISTWKQPVISNVFFVGSASQQTTSQVKWWEEILEIEYSSTHRIHVWYIYLHLVDFYGKCR